MHPSGTAERRRAYLGLRQTPPDSPSTTSVPTQSPTSLNTPSASPGGNLSNRTPIVVITAISLVVIVVFVFATYILQYYHSKYTKSESTTTNFYKALWQKWFPNSKTSKASPQFEPIATYNPGNMTMNDSLSNGNRNRLPNRAESIRSVITLPAYNPHARQNERVLGREGERGGIDVVVEFPHTAEEEEQRRNDEMEALYQVRLARRRENEQREERRRLRREALESGDPVLREALLRRASDTQVGQTIDELRAEHERLKAQRQRAVSVVSYAEVGVARHDGSRLSMSNQESERIGLLGDADSITTSGQSVGRRSTSIRSFDNISSELPVTPNCGLPSTPNTTHVWGIPAERSRRTSRQNSPRSNVSALSPAAARYTNITSSGLPGYGSSPLTSPSYTAILPPDYSAPTLSQPRPEIEISSTSDSLSNAPSDTTQPLPHYSSTNSDSNTKLHSRRSVRGNVPPVPSLKLEPLPSIRVDPASPLMEHDLNRLDRIGEPE
ncbi:hypothetical protein K3495_g4902 [Podosphaera aphanis]|nr:hypothetical protein K3495_g4902 [Podosphaera aphanis]